MSDLVIAGIVVGVGFMLVLVFALVKTSARSDREVERQAAMLRHPSNPSGGRIRMFDTFEATDGRTYIQVEDGTLREVTSKDPLDYPDDHPGWQRLAQALYDQDDES
jgi:hypothetical protein